MNKSDIYSLLDKHAQLSIELYSKDADFIINTHTSLGITQDCLLYYILGMITLEVRIELDKILRMKGLSYDQSISDDVFIKYFLSNNEHIKIKIRNNFNL